MDASDARNIAMEYLYTTQDGIPNEVIDLIEARAKLGYFDGEVYVDTDPHSYIRQLECLGYTVSYFNNMPNGKTFLHVSWSTK